MAAPAEPWTRPMHVRAWANLKRNVIALCVFLRRALVFLAVVLAAPLAVHVEHKSAISPTQVIALSAVDYLTAVNASTALISGKLAARAVEGNTLASESVTNSTKLLAIAVKAVVFPGNFLRAGHLIPEKKQFRSFVTNLFDSGLPLATSTSGWFRHIDSAEHDLLLTASALCIVGSILSIFQGRVSYLSATGLGIWLLLVTFRLPALRPTPMLRIALIAALWDAGRYLYGFARKSNRLGRSSANSKEMAATVKPARTRGKAGSSGGKKGKSSKAD